MFGELARFFLWLGLTAFGGPAAHIAIMQRELVERKQWLSEQEFLSLVSMANLIPGPNSTELAMHIGFKRAGWKGLWVAGLCFIVPGTLITLGLAWWLVANRSLPSFEAALDGMRPVIFAIVAHAFFNLAKAISWKEAVLVGVVAAIATGTQQPALLVIGPALLYVIWRSREEPVDRPSKKAIALLVVVAAVATGLTWVSFRGTLPDALGLFAGFAKIGASLYGSGYTLLSFVEAEFVQRLGWLTPVQLSDGVAIGQMTPGPVFSAATYLGYQMGGIGGATAATLGIFLPAFLLVGYTAPRWQALTEARGFRNFLTAVNLISLGLLLVAAVMFLPEAWDWRFFWVSLVSIAGLGATKVNPTWLLLAGAALGAAWSRFGG